jgi:hypothetical protein
MSSRQQEQATGCSSMPFGDATLPLNESKNPTSRTSIGIATLPNSLDAVSLASKTLRAVAMSCANVPW